MISIDRRRGRHIFIRLFGLQKTKELLALAKAIRKRPPSSKKLEICFDWSELTAWKFDAPHGDQIACWLEAAAFIERIAIVHDRRWNRPAAWFAALLRTGGVEVRSYIPGNCDRACAWLKRPCSGRDVADG
jgi:hypothetical protein